MTKRDRESIRGVAVTLVYLHVALLLVIAIAAVIVIKWPEYQLWAVVAALLTQVPALASLIWMIKNWDA